MNDIGALKNAPTPVACLRSKSREILSCHLNRKRVLLTKDNFSRDWHGLAQKAEIEGEFSKLDLMKCRDAGEFLHLWKGGTVGRLLSFLEEIDRPDVIDDSIAEIEKDVQAARNSSKKKTSAAAAKASSETSDHVLTYDDMTAKHNNQPLVDYHALILHSEDDEPFAEELANGLTERGFMACRKSDLAAGKPELEAMERLIVERCKLVLVVATESFFSKGSKIEKICADLAGFHLEQVRIAPIMRDSQRVTLPERYQMLTKLRYDDKLFWLKLCKNIDLGWNESQGGHLPVGNPRSRAPAPSLQSTRPTLPQAYSSTPQLFATHSQGPSKSPPAPVSDPQIQPRSKSPSWMKKLKNKLTHAKMSRQYQQFTSLESAGDDTVTTILSNPEDAAESQMRLLDLAPDVPSHQPRRQNKTTSEKYKQVGWALAWLMVDINMIG